ncbi:uncharacterized protein Z519_05728 [Cladophialophora bantiana CBS 173.52]|uniref:Uncharacterized protein n=1 Tax=Cladophialophora bantiana (strain ATCC 10958 / CBS 173.52 / CDC B-1940 / NIH 8579) TaxID=1442370 RepID=A0A0D2HIL4_CLAB1|nr:uncharacterized protein Z519_05728 [Cladophialophora bantiana CBS 173.52]KIW93123.1 hypothetical protein Z519_05728 [Cladophialophora bantiana CBS 173.52]
MPTATKGHSALGSARARKLASSGATNGKYELSFKFIGTSYLKLRVSWEMVFYPNTPPAAAPKTFEFAAIWRNWEGGRRTAEKAAPLSRRGLG